MLYRIMVVTGIIGLLYTPQLSAQKKIYSLNDIWQKTLSQYPSLQAKKTAVAQLVSQKELVEKERLPEVNFQAQQSYGSYQNISGSYFPLAGIYNSSGSNKSANGQPNAVSNLYASGVLQWNFLQFGRINKRVAAADAAVQLGRSAVSEEERQLMLAGTRLYFDALQSTALLTIIKADERRLTELLDLSKTQAEAGLRPGADTLLVKSALYQVKGQVHEQQALLASSMIQLASFIGEPVNAFAIDNTSFFKFTNDAAAITTPHNHPYLKYLKDNIHYAKALLKAEERQLYPSVGLLAATGIKGSGIYANGHIDNSISAPWANHSGNYLIGIGVSWQLSALYQNKTKLKIERQKIDIATANYDAAFLQLNAAYQSAVNSWERQKTKLQQARISFETSRQGYELYVSRYENGLIGLIELLQLQKTAQEAEAYHVHSVDAYWEELINQLAATGNADYLLSLIHS